MNRFCCGIIGWDGVAVNEARVAFSASKEHLMKYGRGYHSFTDPIPPELLSNSNAYQDFRRRIMVLDAGYDLPLFTCVCPLSIPFFILLLLGGIGADMQEENEKRGDDNTGPNYQNELWYKALFLVSLIVPFLIAGPLTRPLLEKFDKAVEDTLEEFRENSKKRDSWLLWWCVPKLACAAALCLATSPLFGLTVKNHPPNQRLVAMGYRLFIFLTITTIGDGRDVARCYHRKTSQKNNTQWKRAKLFYRSILLSNFA